MKKLHSFRRFFAIGLFLPIAFAACDKDKLEDIDPTANNDDTPAATPDNPTPTFSDADGVLIAIQSVSYVSQPIIGTIETTIGLGVAVFPDGSGAFQDAGNVTCEAEALTKNANNSYTYTVDANTPTGISFSGMIDWDVAGSSSVSGITKSVSGVFPSSLEIGIASGSDVSTGSSFTLATNDTVSDADSIIFAVHGPNNSVLITKEASQNSHTFSQSDMSSLGTGSGFVQVTAFKVVATETSGTEKFYFLNEKVNTTTVNFD